MFRCRVLWALGLARSGKPRVAVPPTPHPLVRLAAAWQFDTAVARGHGAWSWLLVCVCVCVYVCMCV